MTAKINKKLRLTVPDTVRTLTHEDVLSTLDYLVNLELDLGGNLATSIASATAVRSVGELLQNQFGV